MANTYDTNLILQSIASAITSAATSDPNLLAKLQAIADAITNGGGGGSVTASNVSVVPTSPFVSTNLQNLSVEEANAITANAGDITTINTALGNTSISGIGDGSVTGAIATNNSNINTINTALGNTSISGIGDGSVTGAISSLNSSLTWTQLPSVMGTTFVTIPDSWKEIHILCRYGTSNGLQPQVFTTSILKEQATPLYGYKMGNADFDIQVGFGTANTIHLNQVIVSGTDYVTYSQLNVWYR